MVHVGASGRRYAAAVFELARESDSYDAWLSDLRRLAEIMQVPDAAGALTSPAVPLPQRRAILAQLVPGLRGQVQSFVDILVSRDRLELLPEIVAELERRVAEVRGVTTVEVTTAIPLDAQTEKALTERLATYTGKQVRLESRVDPEILGGVVARVGDELLDDSVRGRLERLRRTLVGSAEQSRG